MDDVLLHLIIFRSTLLHNILGARRQTCPKTAFFIIHFGKNVISLNIHQMFV